VIARRILVDVDSQPGQADHSLHVGSAHDLFSLMLSSRSQVGSLEATNGPRLAL